MPDHPLSHGTIGEPLRCPECKQMLFVLAVGNINGNGSAALGFICQNCRKIIKVRIPASVIKRLVDAGLSEAR